MTIQKLSILAFIFLTFTACKEEKPMTAEVQEDQVVSTFYLIRHAEKDRSNAENVDPVLTQKGLGRAMHWAEILKEVDLDAIYSTDYERTEMTAAPTAVKKDLSVSYYDPKAMDMAKFLEENKGKEVLVVGHSNTTPAFVNALLGEERYSELDDRDNGTLFIVTMVGEQPTATTLKFNCNCPR